MLLQSLSQIATPPHSQGYTFNSPVSRVLQKYLIFRLLFLKILGLKRKIKYFWSLPLDTVELKVCVACAGEVVAHRRQALQGSRLQGCDPGQLWFCLSSGKAVAGRIRDILQESRRISSVYEVFNRECYTPML